jgi:hypothetical protein
LQGIARLVLAPPSSCCVDWRSIVTALLMAASIGGLAISLTGRGLFGYNETKDAPYVVASLVVESVAVATLVAAVVIVFTASRRST